MSGNIDMEKINPKIEILKEKKLVGKRLAMSLADNKTGELWSTFMPIRGAVKNNLTNDLISMQIYDNTHFTHFKLTNEFEKWAAVEVPNFDDVPEGMETFLLAGGLYAVFDYTGRSSDPGIFQHIFGVWLPNSNYVLDSRPHFEILGEKYKNDDPVSEEQIWIPIKGKN